MHTNVVEFVPWSDPAWGELIAAHSLCSKKLASHREKHVTSYLEDGRQQVEETISSFTERMPSIKDAATLTTVLTTWVNFSPLL